MDNAIKFIMPWQAFLDETSKSEVCCKSFICYVGRQLLGCRDHRLTLFWLSAHSTSLSAAYLAARHDIKYNSRN
jgi:hypothetical protein